MTPDATTTPPPRPVPTVDRIWHAAWHGVALALYWSDTRGTDHVSHVDIAREPGRMQTTVCLDA